MDIDVVEQLSILNRPELDYHAELKLFIALFKEKRVNLALLLVRLFIIDCCDLETLCASTNCSLDQLVISVILSIHMLDCIVE